jgi:hypothetical protein
LKGRDLTGTDSAESARVLIINEALARRYFPNEDPIGKHLELEGDGAKSSAWLRTSKTQDCNKR